MKHKKTRHRLKFIALFFGIFLVFYTCQKDTAIVDENNFISLQGFHYSTFMDVKNLKAPVKTNTQRLLQSNNVTSRNSEDTYHFSIDTMVVQTLVSNSYTSYTFIARLHEPDTTKLHNYVLTYFENDSINEMLVAYPRVYNNTNQKYDMDNITARPIDGDVSIFGRTLCYGYPVTSWDANGGNCVDYNCGLAGNHSPGEACEDGEYRAYSECSGAWVTKCLPPSDNDENPDGSSGGGGGNGNDDAIDIIPLDDCENSGDGEVGPNGECFIIVDDRDCIKLKQQISDNALIRTRLKQINDGTSTYERGFRANKNQPDGAYLAGTIQINQSDGSNHVHIRPNPNTAVIAHSHPVNVKYKMFSGADILKMGEMVTRNQSIPNSPVSLTEITHIMVFNNNENTNDPKGFALRFDDLQAAQKLNAIYLNSIEREKFAEKLKKDYKSDTTGPPSYTPVYDLSLQQHHIFDLLNEKGLNLSMYEADFDNNGFITGWQKMERDGTNINRIPCN